MAGIKDPKPRAVVRRAIREAERAGCRVRYAKRHALVYSPDGGFMTALPAQSRETNRHVAAVKHLRGMLRRMQEGER